MKTITSITYSALALFAFACFALSQARAQCRQGCDNNGSENTFLGIDALLQNTSGIENTALGFAALQVNTEGRDNTAVGVAALGSNLTGSYNTANGSFALSHNTTGNNNNAFGFEALYHNTTGPYNNAFGNGALATNTTGDRNTAMGEGAMIASSTGSQNTAVGVSALRNNTTGFGNIAIGQDSCNNNGSASYNTGVGWKALVGNSGSLNTANGAGALYFNTTGGNNTAVGMNALLNNNGSSNLGLGSNAGKNLTTGSGNVCIGAGILGAAGESNTTRIRNIYSSVASGRAVYVNSNNKIGTLASTRRVKNDIKPMDKASEAVLALKPVSFRYKKEIDASGTLQFGLVAEEVADINADLVTRDSEGRPETVRYDAVNAMLLNEFLKARRQIDAQQKQIDALIAGLQKVSAQLEASKLAPQVVNNP